MLASSTFIIKGIIHQLSKSGNLRTGMSYIIKQILDKNVRDSSSTLFRAVLALYIACLEVNES